MFNDVSTGTGAIAVTMGERPSCVERRRKGCRGQLASARSGRDGRGSGAHPLDPGGHGADRCWIHRPCSLLPLGPEFRDQKIVSSASWIGVKSPGLRNRGVFPRVAPGFHHAALFMALSTKLSSAPPSTLVQGSTPCLDRVARRSNAASSREHASYS